TTVFLAKPLAPPPAHPLPLHDALPILGELGAEPVVIPLGPAPILPLGPREEAIDLLRFRLVVGPGTVADARLHHALDALAEERRSEEHTSELQSRSDLVCRLLLEKKKI